MTAFHVILVDECGDEFSVTINAQDEQDAWDTVSMDYPESGVVAVMRPYSYRQEARNRVFNDLWES